MSDRDNWPVVPFGNHELAALPEIQNIVKETLWLRAERFRIIELAKYELAVAQLEDTRSFINSRQLTHQR